jgi:hypothetical protein
VRWGWTLAFLVACGNRGPTLVTPLAQLPPVADIVKTCAFEVSCLKDPPTSYLNTCISYFLAALGNESGASTDFARYVDCARQATDCTSVLRCASRDHDPAFCAAHPGETCDGDLLVQCAPAGQVADWAIYNTDCSALGMHCAAANGSAACTDGAACDPQLLLSHCDGNTYVGCNSPTNLRFTLDCSRSPIINATCRTETGSSVGGCMPSGPSCQSSVDRCDGDMIVLCVAGEETRVDCAQQAGHCAIVAYHGRCVPIATQCDDASGDHCSGNTLATCVDGVPQTIDCSSVGLSTCSTSAGGASSCR